MPNRSLILLLLFLFLTSCGYTPIYSSKENNRLNISVENYEGDNDINFKIISKLRTHKNLNTEEFKIKIKTDYKKTDLSKDITGKIQDYELTISSTFEINYSDTTRNFTIKETFTMKNLEDDFEERNYEKTIKENLANSIYQKLMIQMLKFE
tara:strand:+ start:1526 stop:1981 length:456 start_codon:yes stop_codon:yes gene_type:complete